jgi:hypothetical protein
MAAMITIMSEFAEAAIAAQEGNTLSPLDNLSIVTLRSAMPLNDVKNAIIDLRRVGMFDEADALERFLRDYLEIVDSVVSHFKQKV